MADIKFLEKLKTYDRENIPPQIMDKVKKIVTKKEFDPDKIFVKSQAAGGLAKWCSALNSYYDALKIVRPKEAKCREMNIIYQEALAVVDAKQKELDEIKENL